MSRKAKKINLDQNTIADAVQKTGSRAASYLHDPAKARQLLTSAMGKAGEQKPTDGPLAEVWHYLQALLRLLGAYTRREYTDIPWGSILLVAGAILYFVMPVDLIPDLIPVGGLVDDAAVIVFVANRIKTDLDTFVAWEAHRPAAGEAPDTTTQP
jgi:uncharacterized membrane protein YkvA (DUF1232 family)